MKVNLFVVVIFGCGLLAQRAEPADDTLAGRYASDIRPLVVQFCGECHSEERAEAEIQLATLKTFDDVRKESATWLKVLEMLDTEQMPPVEAKQPNDSQRAMLRGWVRQFLKEESKRFAGDPGPVVLRRLTNAEYTYVIGDLTGVDSLRPAREFPVDGAAGEGFTNAGNALAMSPALLAKYLDAGKDIAAHAVLLPDGIRFSSSTTRRDWTEEILADIRRMYARYSDSQGASQVNLQGVIFDTNGGGRLPLDRYLDATLVERAELQRGTKSIDSVARQRGLSTRYLGALWNLMNSDEPDSDRGSRLLSNLRQRWRVAQPEDVPTLVAEVAKWQQALWRFASVGHIGKVGGPKAWMEPVNPLVARHEMRVKLPAASDGKHVVLYLATADAGDGNEHDYAIWERPRLVAPGRPDLLLRDVRAVTHELAVHRARVFAATAKCLAAAAEANSTTETKDIAQLASNHQVDAVILGAWLDYLGIGSGGPTRIDSPITRQATSLSGYDFIRGWVGENALSVVANSSDQHVRIPGNMNPHTVAVHPTPTLQVGVGWQSPVSTTLRIEGWVQHAHPECGNGVVWMLELRRGTTRQRLTAGTAHGANKTQIGRLDKIAVQKGDLISLVVGPKDGNHSCDLTAIDFTLRDAEHEWNLARDISPDILAGNPHDDRFGNPGVWHFYSEPTSGAGMHVIPAGSLLAQWLSAGNREEQNQIAQKVQQLLETGPGTLPADSPDVALFRQLTSLGGPLFASALQAISKGTNAAKPPPDAAAEPIGLDPAMFGKHPNGSVLDAPNLCVQAPSVIEVRLPAELVAGAEFVTGGVLHLETGKDGSVQFQVLTNRPESAAGLQPTAVTLTNANGPWTSNHRGVLHSTPIVVTNAGSARGRFEAEFDEFRQWFPPALCYTKIVPVDEVVTLTLFYREDDHLRRLMLDEQETAQLNRLWDELHFVSHDALTLVDALAQLIEYATQDADPKVFEPLRKPFQDRADAFCQQLVGAEPRHIESVLEIAARAYRRPLTEAESNALRKLYRSLRDEELAHDESIRLMIARLLISPEFLYRVERPESPAGSESPQFKQGSAAVSDLELATRLSFFLWSSMPDSELRGAAVSGKLKEPSVLLAQTRRLLKDNRARRLATEFGCQWLHIYEFDKHDEKSETTFPSFAGLRGPMYEESIRFLTDLIQRDGSILEVLDADHTFVNGELATHYGISWKPSGDSEKGDWRRIDGLKQHGRGGILAMASTLSKQSGASRTSPILRGNWISEVLLGDKLPKPPKGVPVLPEIVPMGLTERQLIEKHSSDPACAKCHARIDPLGFALEGFDAIGRARTKAENSSGPGPGIEIDTRSQLRDGTPITGLSGLRTYLATQRRDDFVRQFCRKLLGYATGRAVILSDEPLLDEMQSQLNANQYRFSVAVELIVQSPQFQRIRVGSEDDSPSSTRTGAK